MNGYELKQKVKAGGIVYGTMLSTSRNPRWAAPMSNFGLDYVIIDTEHSPRGRDEVADFLAAFNFSGVVPIIRVPIPDSHYITMALDAGAHGAPLEVRNGKMAEHMGYELRHRSALLTA